MVPFIVFYTDDLTSKSSTLHLRPSPIRRTTHLAWQQTQSPVKSISSNLIMDIPGLAQEPFPVHSREAAGSVNGIQTEVTVLDFADKILLTISQEGSLSQWVRSRLLARASVLEDPC